MRTTGAAGQDRGGGERWTIERHGRRNLRRRQFHFALRRIGASGNSAAEAPHHDRGIVRRRVQARLRPESRRGGGRLSINPESAINFAVNHE
jgi:hypothetical protein